MVGWRVHPAGVKAVAAAVVVPAESITAGISSLPDATTSAMKGGDSDLVSGALAAFFEQTTPLLEAAQQRVPAAMTGLRNTAQAVIDGDDEIATGIDAQAVTGFTGWQPPPGVRQPK